ncbi:histidine--tRNA ligase, chloroplastic/mitochondrial-like [Hordeum vulgare subsp. vulgare]|uniref:histidine--tRNA ligase, chloroplastic/mitochondrial-like n=1 Tax=Hordeum vulgare subsp. vulgare TaxID=112509 RepID=UPI001D1A5202|nr:histidine--tRNA ligase, chloroplastic/mitochondrial-like [Hordeum vulgare subsp. vulgare]
MSMAAVTKKKKVIIDTDPGIGPYPPVPRSHDPLLSRALTAASYRRRRPPWSPPTPQSTATRMLARSAVPGHLLRSTAATANPAVATAALLQHRRRPGCLRAEEDPADLNSSSRSPLRSAATQASTLDKTIGNLETELPAARTLQESFLNGSPVSQEYKAFESFGRHKYLMIISINTAFSSCKRRDSIQVLGSGVEAVADLKKLFSFAEQYGYADWICFDASVVRGLAYYTGIVFEAFDREGELRAICGGGRYDRLLSTFGTEDVPACGFGFGDAVIVELLKEKGLLPDLSRQIDDIVFPLDEELEGPASSVASSLRKKGRSADLVEDKRLKWVFKHAERINASRLILVGKSEWERGMVRVKILSTREEFEVKAGELQ